MHRAAADGCAWDRRCAPYRPPVLDHSGRARLTVDAQPSRGCGKRCGWNRRCAACRRDVGSCHGVLSPPVQWPHRRASSESVAHRAPALPICGSFGESWGRPFCLAASIVRRYEAIELRLVGASQMRCQVKGRARDENLPRSTTTGRRLWVTRRPTSRNSLRGQHRTINARNEAGCNVARRWTAFCDRVRLVVNPTQSRR
jgi:hypothetical protein